MLDKEINSFIKYCQVSNFSKKSIESLSSGLYKFNTFISSANLDSLQEISYQHLLNFVRKYNNPSIHIKKARVWSLHQFFHFLKLNDLVEKNIALGLPYPKIEKTVPQYLTSDEYNLILDYYYQKANSFIGLRNLIIIMFFGFLALRNYSIVSLNIEDIDITAGLVGVTEKGRLKKRLFILPNVLCKFLEEYLFMLKARHGPLFLSKLKKRISARTLQSIFQEAECDLNMSKHLHAHIFRHTAATLLNKVSTIDITQSVLGHTLRQNTDKYTHLNPDQYAVYMKKHPYMNLKMEDNYAGSN